MAALYSRDYYVQELAIANNQLVKQEKAATYYKDEVERQSNRYTWLERERAELQEEVNTKQATIDQYIGREDVVYKKPGLVERLEKRAMDKFFKEIDSDDD